VNLVEIGALQSGLSAARHGRNQKHGTEETMETEDFGVCVAGKNSLQAAEISVDRGREKSDQAGEKGSPENSHSSLQ
jgi:hypothetical protein